MCAPRRARRTQLGRALSSSSRATRRGNWRGSAFAATVLRTIEALFFTPASRPAEDSLRSDLGIETLAPLLARLTCLLTALFALGCTEGGTVQGTLPSGFLGDPDGNVVSTLDVSADDDAQLTADTDVAAEADAADVAMSDVDVEGSDALEGADVDVVGPQADIDAADDADVTPCTPGEPGCGCATDAHCMALDDGNLCNGRMVCSDGECVEDPSPTVCDADTGNPCTTASCDPATGACTSVNLPSGMACDDGDACTPNDRCEEGVCRSAPRITCDDRNPCTVDTCSDGECVFSADDTLLCDDGNGCTLDDACSNGLCQGSPSDACGCEEDADWPPLMIRTPATVR